MARKLAIYIESREVTVRNRNPLAANTSTGRLTRFVRLHILLRDAYHSEPCVTRIKLDGLESLRMDALSTLPMLEESASPAATNGVRLAERLRYAIGLLGEGQNVQMRRRIVIDLLFSVAPPAGQSWARHVEPLIADVAGLLGLNLSTTDLNRLVRGHRAAQRAMWHTARHRGASSVSRQVGDPHEPLTEALSSAMCLRPEAALTTAITLIRGSRDRAEPASLAGGPILDRLDSRETPAIDKYVGTAVARASLPALVHHLATLETTASDDVAARTGVQPLLRNLRTDILSTQARDEEEQRTLAAAARLVETARDRLERRPRPRFGGLRSGSRQATPEPDYRA